MAQLSLQINDTEKPTKPILVAICGKSASGKNTLRDSLYGTLIQKHARVHVMISDTTRPCRINEIDGVDYNFVSKEVFWENIEEEKYIEYAQFKRWYYGTQLREIKKDEINLGIFNIAGLKRLASLSDNYDIIVVYLKVNLWERLRRSYRREHQFSREYLRRAIVDFFDFYKIEDYIANSFSNYIILDKQFLAHSVQHVMWTLYHKGII